MSNALANLGGEFTGKYYPLSKMTEAEQDQLINVKEQYSYNVHCIFTD